MNKASLRIKGLEARKQMNQKMVTEYSKAIIAKLLTLPEYLKADSILFYYSIKNEVQTSKLIEIAEKDKKIYLPKLISNSHFEALPYEGAKKMLKNQHGIKEPIAKSETNPSFDLVIVPGVLFDENGGRVGMGKGYYDRFLEGKNDVIKVALCYELQILADLPKEPYDELVDIILTEKRVIRCNK